jgi:CBS domain-containing protein
MPDIKDIKLKIKETGKPYSITVRDLMKSVGQYRRDASVNHTLRALLESNKLTTDPEFEVVNIQSKVKIITLSARKTVKRKSADKTISRPKPKSQSTNTYELVDVELEVVRTIGQLPSAVRKPIFIKQNESLQKATTLMLQEGVGHLVVTPNGRRVEGVVTWNTIVQANAGRRKVSTVSDCLDKEAYTVKYDAPLFDTVREITRRGLAVVLSKTNTIEGSVTTTDVAEQFATLSEPFLFIEQIENHLRILLRGVGLSLKSLRELADSKDEARMKRLKSVSDLSFGEIRMAFARAHIWEEFQLNLDQKTIVESLTKVNTIRNKVMHFHPDGISDEDRELLGRMRAFFQAL